MNSFSRLGWSIKGGSRSICLSSLFNDATKLAREDLSSVTSAFTKLRSQLLRSGIIIKCLVVMCSDCGDDSAIFFEYFFGKSSKNNDENKYIPRLELSNRFDRFFIKRISIAIKK